MNAVLNKYVDTYINYYVRPFRGFIKSKFNVEIGGLADFITPDDHDVAIIISELNLYGFEVAFSNGHDTVDEIQVRYICDDNGADEDFEYQIQNLISILNLSSTTGISIVGILLMQIISRIICKYKVIYKAIVLDLDDTVWKGTLADDGIEVIKQNLNSRDASAFVTFMRFIRAISKELGLYVAICSRNDEVKVLSAIDRLNEKEFPLKGQIDCIVANYNDKSKNIKAIAERLSILTSACIFIDDNLLVRDEVRDNLPEVFVPAWDTHAELLTILEASCVFDRFELSIKSRMRKRLYEVLQQERQNSYLPNLLVKVTYDVEHTEAVRLYAKSNQFKFVEKVEDYGGCKSLLFEMYRENGENLGVCSALTYRESEQGLLIKNWAISCRYFEIGLEEYILMYVATLSARRPILFSFHATRLNGKAVALTEKYKSGFIKTGDPEIIKFIPNVQLINEMSFNTKLEEYSNE